MAVTRDRIPLRNQQRSAAAHRGRGEGGYEHNRHLGKFKNDIESHEDPQPEKDEDTGRLPIHDIPGKIEAW